MAKSRLGTIRLLALAAGLVWLASPAAALADLVHTTRYASNPISGTTPQALWRAMNAHPIIDPDDGPAYANLTHDHELSLKSATAGGVCRVSELTFRWRFVLTLPKAVEAGAMSPSTRALWTSFVASLKRHEETHRQIFLDCGKAFVPAAARLTGRAGCLGFERQVRQFVDRRYAACMARQRAFEERDRPHVTGHPFIGAAMKGAQ